MRSLLYWLQRRRCLPAGRQGRFWEASLDHSPIHRDHLAGDV